jgi:hypothetical protein
VQVAVRDKLVGILGIFCNSFVKTPIFPVSRLTEDLSLSSTVVGNSRGFASRELRSRLSYIHVCSLSLF